ncbi:MAG: MtrB/PioB family outer membrane beta-barrel protein [Betaproteobacteria bacterium]|nr:MtrB/PioB family outer membrane beta-barrel protein [Betaproteobacteria bacterium]
MTTKSQHRTGRLTMVHRPRTTVIAASVSIALAPFALTAALADSATGTDTVISNTMNQGIAAGPPRVDAELDIKRSPIGILYGYDTLVAEPAKKAGDGWDYKASIEFGGISSNGDRDNPFYTRYRDVDSGFYLRNFTVRADKPAEGAFFDAYAGSVARDDQFYSIAFGRYNAWKVKAYFNETPSISTNAFRSLWSGMGTGNQTLVGLTPGGLPTAAATQTALQAAIAAAPDTELAITRKKGGIRADFTLSENWKLYAAYTSEKKQGSNPYGLIFGGGGGGGDIEAAEPVDWTTNEFRGGVQYFDGINSFNITAEGSLYRNDLNTFTVQNPLTITVNTLTGVSANTFTSARFDSYPDNEFYKIKGEYARSLPQLMNGRFSAVVAATRSSQDDSLIAPTTLPLTGGMINGISAANVWNTTDALTRTNSGAEITTKLANLSLALSPARNVGVRANWRYYETDNSTDYIACNPLTGQVGRLINDGSGGAFVNTPAYLAAKCNLDAIRALNVAPSAGNVNIANVPFEYKQENASLSADWRIDMKSNLTGSIERETFKRQHRERDETNEDKLKIGYTNRGFESVTLLLSAEGMRRRGSDYNPDPYEEFQSASLGPLPTATGTNYTGWIHVMDSFRKFDLADRDQRTLNGRINWAAAPTLDFGLSGQWKDMSYPDSEYGRNGTNRQSFVSLEANWQASAEFALYGNYSWQSGKMHQLGLQANACAVGATYYFYSNGVVNTTGIAPTGTTLVGTTLVAPGNAGLSTCETAAALNPLYPTSRTWEQIQDSRNQTGSIGLRRDFGVAKLDAAYTYVNGTTTTSYTYNAAALGLTAAQVALIGSGMPEARFTQNTIEANLSYPVNKTMALRLYGRYERGKVNDWHYDGVAQNPVPANNAAYLDKGPGDYSASTVGLFLKVDF